uniref:Uncharacterized protein n=1 Tax=Cajanus cajan TaxID=3821 RepID=A0A151R5X8_CAJCA|nr:hypothetical protein KK1_040749 [Cajanus cajan]
MDLDLALWTEKPTPTPKNSDEDKVEKWKCSNQMCLMIMKRFVAWAHKEIMSQVRLLIENSEAYVRSLLNRLVVKERVQNKQISIKHIMTNFMLADPLIKGLVPKVFHKHTTHMGGIPYSTLF